MKRRIVLVGASGVFGERLASLIAPWPDVTLVLAARSQAPLVALRERLGEHVEVAVFDRNNPDRLSALSPWTVVDAAGPFQGAGYALALAAVEAGAHYVDLADGRAFVAWRDAVWVYVYGELAKFEAGERAQPTIESFIAELPTMEWPEG